MAPWLLSRVFKDMTIHSVIFLLQRKDNEQHTLVTTMKDFSTARLSGLVLPDCFHQRPAA
jgi:hypothetical protein